MTSLFTKINRLSKKRRQRIKEAIELLEGEPCLVSKSKSNIGPDDRLGLYAQIEQLTAERDVLLAAMRIIAGANDCGSSVPLIHIAKGAVEKAEGGAA